MTDHETRFMIESDRIEVRITLRGEGGRWGLIVHERLLRDPQHSGPANEPEMEIPLEHPMIGANDIEQAKKIAAERIIEEFGDDAPAQFEWTPVLTHPPVPPSALSS